MAIAIEAYVVVVKIEALLLRYPGGVEAFEMNAPNRTFCRDDSLARVSFMLEADAGAFFRELGSLGIDIGQDGDAVICDGFHQKVSPDSGWLWLGTYQKSTIGWLEGEEVRQIVGPSGWNPEESRLTHISPEEAARRLKFLRNEDNVQVFWDNEQMQEVYIGRTQVPLELLFQQAGAIVTARLRNPGSPPAPAEDSVELRRAVKLLEEVIERSPKTWAAHWLLGKAWHALDKTTLACEALRRAFELEKENADVPRELSGVCLELGLADEAVTVAEHAVGREPESHEHLGNLALAYLIAGRLSEAQKTIQAGLRRKPEDPVNQALQRVIKEVSAGSRPPPRNLFDLTRART